MSRPGHVRPGDDGADAPDPIQSHTDAGAETRAGRRFTRVACCSGHMIDRHDRPSPRFPEGKEEAVRAAMAEVLDRWGIGRGDLAVSGGARGADILFAELCLERGAWVRLLIALPDEQFIARSVRLPGTDWEKRYRRLRQRCETWHRPCGELPAPGTRSGPAMTDTNHWILATCRAEAAPDPFLALLVWDEQGTGDGPGGTADFAAEARRLGGEVVIVNPMLLGGDA